MPRPAGGLVNQVARAKREKRDGWVRGAAQTLSLMGAFTPLALQLQHSASFPVASNSTRCTPFKPFQRILQSYGRSESRDLITHTKKTHSGSGGRPACGGAARLGHFYFFSLLRCVQEKIKSIKARPLNTLTDHHQRSSSRWHPSPSRRCMRRFWSGGA